MEEKENQMPELEVAEEETEFNHDEHMVKVEEGLRRILESNDINEIKTIAQSLLEEEQKEQVVEEGKPELDKEEISMQEYLGGK